MKRFLFTLAVLAIWTNAGFAQTKEIQDELDKKLKDLRTEDELLRQALASHPDVLVAQAKRQVAEAEFAQVKLALAQKLSKLELAQISATFLAQTASIEVNKLIELRRKGTSNNDEVDKAQLNAQLAGERVKQIQKEMQFMAPYPDVSKNPNPPKSVERRSLDQHPDALAALAKLRVADAELAQTKLVISQKIATLKAKINGHKQTLSALESHFKDIQNLQANGVASKAEFVPFQIRVLETRNLLSRLQSELKSMTELRQSQAEARPAINQYMGDATGGIGELPLVAQFLLKSSAVANRPAGSAAEKLTAVLDKKVKFEAKAQPAAEVIKSLKEKYGLDVMIRMPLLEKDGGFPLERITISVNPGDMTFTTWLELIMDDLNSKMNQEDMKFAVYVREYGLLITPTKLVPQDAVTLKEFARQVRAEKEREKEKEKAATEPLKP
jgi:outer membrane protein TolC